MFYYYLYEISNNLNGKIYVGVHKTRDMNDGYMGSGKVIVAAIKKYGIENFTKVILEQFEDATAMYAREKEVVTDEFLLREDVYNLRCGGSGGFDYINKAGFNFNNASNPKTLSKIHLSLQTRLRIEGRTQTEITADKIRRATHKDTLNKMTKKEKRAMTVAASMAALTDKAKEKRKSSFSSILHQQGEKNSQFGKMWIHNLDLRLNKSVKVTDVEQYYSNGWEKGRIMKFGQVAKLVETRET